MAHLKVPYETTRETGVSLNLEVPDKNLRVQFIPREPKPVPNLGRAVQEAIESPIKGPKFSDLLGKKKRVTFIIENQFRAAPAHAILPILVEKAKQAGCDISIIIGNAALPPLSREEIEKEIGDGRWLNRVSPLSAMTPADRINTVISASQKPGLPSWCTT